MTDPIRPASDEEINAFRFGASRTGFDCACPYGHIRIHVAGCAEYVSRQIRVRIEAEKALPEELIAAAESVVAAKKNIPFMGAFAFSREIPDLEVILARAEAWKKEVER